MPLPPVVQEFGINAAAYLAGMTSMITATDQLAASIGDVLSSATRMSVILAADFTAAEAAISRSADAAEQALAVQRDTTAVLMQVTDDAALAMTRAALAINSASAKAGGASTSFGNLAAKTTGVLIPALVLLDAELDRKIDAFGKTALGAAALAGALKTTTAPAAAAGAAVAAAGVAAAGAAVIWGLTRTQLHWIVMGSLEVASTALPAMVAFGAGVAGLTPTFQQIYQQMNNLVTASGGIQQALANSTGPLQKAAAGYGTLSKALAPAAYQIFGSVINDLTGRVGTFSKVATQSGNVLAAFASKITTDLNGPAGQQLAGFFSNSVKYMVQWGQVLGNLGHAFLNIVGSMWGIGQVLLDVLVALSRAFLALTNNPVTAFLIGIAAAMSAVYRYGQLLVVIWKWLGGAFLVTALRAIVAGLAAAILQFGILGGVATAAAAAIDLALGPVGIAIAAIGAAVGVWYLFTHQAADATQQLISKVEAMPPTVQNLSKGIAELSAQLGKATQVAGTAAVSTARFGTVTIHGYGDVNALTGAIRKQAQELINLQTGFTQMGQPLGAVGADMNALAIQSGLASSKVSQVNSALDQFMAGVTGGQAGVAGFVTSIGNIGQVAGSTANNLGTATGRMTLNVRQFAAALGTGLVHGAGAWTNFTQIVGSTMPQLADWFRTAAAEGAITGTKAAQAYLDMASAMVPFAKNSAQAQSDLVAFAQAQGLNIHTFPQLLAAIKNTHASLGNLAKITADTSIAMGNLSKIAQNMSATLNSQATTAIANASLKASGFNTQVNNLTAAMQKYGANSPQAVAASNAVTSAFDRAQRMAAQVAQNARTAQAAIDAMHGKTVTITTNYIAGGAHTFGQVSAGGTPAPATSSGPMASAGVVPLPSGGGTTVHVHVAGSVIAEQDLARHIVTVVNRQTGRNHSTQMTLPGRLR